MKLIIGKAFLLGLAVVAGTAACSEKSTKSSAAHGAESSGTVGLQLQLGPGVTLSTLDWTITNPALLGADRKGSVDVSHSQAVRFVVGGLPAGGGYTIALTGKTDGANPLSCVGTASFTVTQGATSPVAVSLLCSGGNADGGANGSVSVNGTVNIAPACAAVTSLSASASEVDVGYQLTLAATGISANGTSAGVGFTWAITGGTGAGTFGAASSATTSFQCTKAGPVKVTVTASVADGGSCTNNTSSVDLQCDDPQGSADAGTVAPDASTVTPDASTATPDAGSVTPDAGGTTPDASTAPSACAEFNNGAGCTPTEQRFVDKSADCYKCMINGGCLDDAKFGDTSHECGDVTGNAAKGAKAGTPRSSLCLDTLDCILDPATKCASDDVNICYCGALGAGNGCATATSGANGACFQREIDGLEHLAADAPSAVLPDYTTLSLGAGIANQLFVCAKSNGCDTVCSK